MRLIQNFSFVSLCILDLFIFYTMYNFVFHSNAKQSETIMLNTKSIWIESDTHKYTHSIFVHFRHIFAMIQVDSWIRYGDSFCVVLFTEYTTISKWLMCLDDLQKVYSMMNTISFVRIFCSPFIWKDVCPCMRVCLYVCDTVVHPSVLHHTPGIGVLNPLPSMYYIMCQENPFSSWWSL